MKVSLQWLRDFAPLDSPLEALVQALVDTGTEVDRVHRGPEGVVVARVTALEPVPESTRGVRFADIDLGPRGTERVLTGAPNVSAGDLVPYAPPGTLLPGWDQPLGVRTMFQKYQSPGMLLSAVELGVGDDADGLLILDRGDPGQPIHDVVPLDVVLELDVTTNRPDCLCHLGIARELAASLGEELRKPDCTIPEASRSAVPIHGRATVHVDDTEGCHRFMVRIIEGVRVGPSPGWMQRRLEAIGLRPINNIVDVTNYIAHEMGEPLHAFDYDAFLSRCGCESAEVHIRGARDDERLVCLDGVERTLRGGDLVVCAGDEPVSLAGVMGGASTAVSETTTRVMLEAASWAGTRVRGTSNHLALRSDASTLFEKGLSDRILPDALDRAAALIAETGSGHVLDGVIDEWPAPLPEIPPVAITGSRLSALLGGPVDATEAATVLVRLGFVVEQEGDQLRVSPPPFRRDVLIPEDVVEEVGRSIGYGRLPNTLPGRRTEVRQLAPAYPPEERTRDVLVGAGFDEAITWSFVSPQLAETVAGVGEERRPIPIRNPLSEEWSVLRTSCLPGLCSALAGNLNRGSLDVSLFELGRVFWEGERRGRVPGSTADGADEGLPPLPAEPMVLGLVAHAPDAETAAQTLRFFQSALDGVAHELSGRTLHTVPASLPGLRPGRAGDIFIEDRRAGLVGELDERVSEKLGLRGRTVVAELVLDTLVPERPHQPRFRQPPRFPAIVNDLAVTVPDATTAADGLAAIREAGGTLLVEAELYDEFRGHGVPEGRKGWTFRLTFRAADRTLRDSDAKAALDAITVALRARCEARPRT